MPTPDLPNAKLNQLLAAMLLLLLGAGLCSYVLYGPYYSPDTVNYFNFSASALKENSWWTIYAPAYPFLLYILSMAGFSVFKAAHLLIIIQYGLSSYFLFRWTKTISAHCRFCKSRAISLFLLLWLIYHSWWSFRIFTWAHADSVFYCLLLVWLYFLSRSYLTKAWAPLIVLSVISASMVWVKLNALVLIPFYALLIVLHKERSSWLAPLGMTAASYLAYRSLTHYRLIDPGSLDIGSGGNLMFSGGMKLLASNLAEFFKSTLGFFFSDFLTMLIPHGVALVGGGLILLSLIFLALKEIKNGLSLHSLFLFFGLLYLLCLLGFLQLIGSEEINYRTIFPFFLSCSGYGLTRLFHRNTIPRWAISGAALLICGYTLAGHVWLWNRTDVNSMFEVERLSESGMIKEVRLLHQEFHPQVAFMSNRPEKLGLVLNDPFITHSGPEFTFMQGKRRLVPSFQRQQTKAILLEKLLRAEAVLVIFGEDEAWLRLANENGLAIAEFPEGLILSRPE